MNIKKPGYQHVYIDQGKKVIEKTEAQALLAYIYTSFLGRVIRLVIRSRIASWLFGKYQSSHWSRKKIDKFIQKHSIKMQDFIVPQEGYSSFNDFFCRSLVQGSRQIDPDPRAFLSPADAKCWAIQEITSQASFFVKQKEFSLFSLLQDQEQAKYYEGGSLLVLRLAPYDYHRFHAPVSGFFSGARSINGVLESVNPIVFKNNCMPLLENERQVIAVEAKDFNCNLLMIPVGAMFVGKIKYTANLPGFLNKADEVGFFEFGGSSLVLLLPRGVLRVRADLAAYTARGFEVAVKMGESLGVFIE